MIYSMTGAGKSTAQCDGKNITVFVKTLNSKQLDTSVRLPAICREREIEIRNMIAERVQRGKVDFTFSIDDGVADNLLAVQRLNEAALSYYAETITPVSQSLGLGTPSLEILLRLPGVLVPNTEAKATEELSEREWMLIRDTIVKALEQLQSFRAQEGEMLRDACLARIKNIRSLLEQVDAPESERIPAIRQRLEEALGKLSVDAINNGRLEQELIFYIEKLDINEEKDRLRHHLNYFEEVIELPQGAQGKTLGFIAQEIGREINTLGSKSNNAEMQQIVVRMKDELEQIKEQSLNIL